ncbi:MAG: PocR ligand-binding domain-containing protein [Thermodesulfobacteriota bacterium]
MKANILDFIDFKKVDTLLEGFNKSTGFVTAILDLQGKVLSKSGWRQICTEFHRVNPETSKNCTVSDTVLAGETAEGESYHFYQCLNGLVDVAVPVVIDGKHIANLFSGQLFFEEPDRLFFKKQAEAYGFDEEKYLEALDKVPVVSKERVKTVMAFLLNMTRLISETTFQRLEQQELKEAVLKSEERFKTFMEETPVYAYIKDGSLNPVFSNKKVLELSQSAQMGRTADSAKTLFDPEIAEYLEDADQKIVSGHSNRIELEYKVKIGGRDKWFNEIKFPLKLTDGTKGVGGLAFDISERKGAEEELLKSVSLLRVAGRIARFGGWSVNLTGGKVIWSEEVAAIHDLPSGFSPSLTEGIDFYAPEWKDKIASVFSACAQDGTPYDEEMQIITALGRRLWVRTIGEAVRDETGAIIQVRGAFQDITERKKNEEERERLIASERAARSEANKAKEQVTQILERISDGFGSLDREWRYTFVNEKLAQTVGRRREDLIGCHIWTEFPDAVGTQVHQAYLRAMADQVPIDLEHYYPPFERWFQHRFYPSPDGLTVFSRDITERKQGEEELKKHRDRLEELVKERTAELETKIKEIDRMNKIFVGRELRMIELKERIKALEAGNPATAIDGPSAGDRDRKLE